MNARLSTPPASLPAVIFVDAAAASLSIASLSLTDRLLVAVHRAGAGPITLVCRGALPPLKRSRALGIDFRVLTEAPPLAARTLVAASTQLVQAGDIRQLLEHGGALQTADGTRLPIGIVEPGGESWETALGQLPATPAAGVACIVRNKNEAREAEKHLWRSLGSASDGFVDRIFNRPCGRPLSKWLIHTPASPNAISIASALIGLAAAFFFALGNLDSIILGAVLFQLSAIVDCVDGDVARVVFKESPSGKWIDLVGDQVVHAAVFAGIALGLDRTGQEPKALWLGLTAVVGALVSFAVVLRGMRRARAAGGLADKVINAASNRDFSILTFALACFGRLDWFLWLAAAGSHAFWMTALGLQLARPGKAAR